MTYTHTEMLNANAQILHTCETKVTLTYLNEYRSSRIINHTISSALYFPFLPSNLRSGFILFITHMNSLFYLFSFSLICLHIILLFPYLTSYTQTLQVIIGYLCSSKTK